MRRLEITTSGYFADVATHHHIQFRVQNIIAVRGKTRGEIE